MKRLDWRWCLAGFVVIAVGLAVAVAIHKAGYACANPHKRGAMKIVEANGCVEFWFNRYQSLIGSALAAAFAGISLFWVAAQLRSSNRQTAVAAAQGLRIVAAELSHFAAELKTFDPDIRRLYGLKPNYSKPGQYTAAMREQFTVLHRLEAAMSAWNEARSRPDDPLREAVSGVLSMHMRCWNMEASLAELGDRRPKDDTEMADILNNTVSLSTKLRNHEEELRSLVGSMQEIYQGSLGSLALELRTTWDQIRLFESQAVGKPLA